MPYTRESRRTTFRRVAQRSYIQWPAYESTPLYDRTSLTGLESDIRVVAETWFDHENHHSVEGFVCVLPLAYFQFSAHDRYEGPTCYQMDTLFRVFVLKELHGWEHETALVGYLGTRPELCEQLGFETIPDQSTLWRSWHERFTPDLRETVETAARTILIKAQNAGVEVPREPARKLRYHGNESDESDPDDQTTLEQAEKVTDHINRIVFPAFSLDRGESCEIHENAYWELQTYLAVSGWLRTKGLVASPTSRLGNGHRWGTPIASRFGISLSSRFARCTGRLSLGS